MRSRPLRALRRLRHRVRRSGRVYGVMSCVVLFLTWCAVSAEWTSTAMVIVGFALLALVLPSTPRERRTRAAAKAASKSRRVA